MAARAYYGVTLLSAVWRCVAHTGLYVILVLLPAVLIVAISAMDVEAFLAFMAA